MLYPTRGRITTVSISTPANDGGDIRDFLLSTGFLVASFFIENNNSDFFNSS